MLGKEFRSLAEAVTCTYGENPWFFLRELAQNSRDAGASSITVKAETTSTGLEILTFADDGRGMSQIHARRYLFRLYASDKTWDTAAAGKYGIGFWTILGFQPDQVLIQSRCKDEAWGIALDANLEARPAPCALTAPGTVIRLSRKAVYPDAVGFSQVVDKELRAHCQYLRRNDRRGTMLPVFFDGQNITIPFSLPGPLSHSFHEGAVEGAVGLGEKPLVRLYARGLPVWEGAVLGQMSHLQHPPDIQSEIGRGLAPVFLLNGNRLDVTFSRNLVQENRAMEKVRKTAEKALQRLLANAMESAFPRKWTQRGAARARVFFDRFRRPDWKLLPLLLLLILPLEILILNRFFPVRRVPGPSTFDLNSASIQYGGPTVGGPSSQLGSHFTYSPPDALWFRVFAAVDYDLRTGFVRPADTVLSPPAPFRPCAPEKTVQMQFSAGKAGRTVLPLPPGHAIDPERVTYSPGERPLKVTVNDRGESSAEFPGGGTVFYRSCPQPGEHALTPAEKERLTRLPAGLSWPADLETSLAGSQFWSPGEKAALAVALVRARIRFDASAATIRSYRLDAGDRQWLERVLAIGKGDCDVINGFHVLLLRRMGLPARLAIGLVGDRGRIRPGLHAWSEYFANGWHVADASAGPAENAAMGAGAGKGALPENRAPARPAVPVLRPLPILVLAAIAAVLAALAWLLWKKASTDAGKRAASAATATREMVLPVIRQALLRPEIWGQQSPLWNHRFLPVLRGRPMTIRRALTLLRRRRLQVTTERSPLALALGRARLPVLDLSQECFAPLRPLLSSAVHLDRFWQLRPQPPGRPGDPRTDLLHEVNNLLARLHAGAARCFLAAGLSNGDFSLVSLPTAPRLQGVFFPRRFIAVNPSARVVAQAAVLMETNRPLAVFRFLRALNAGSLLPVADTQAFMRKAARRLLSKDP